MTRKPAAKEFSTPPQDKPMFVPVACSECGKPFQVPDATVGNPTVCPWCQATVPALPVGVPAPAAAENRGLTPPARQEPESLSLDDEAPPSVARQRRFRLPMILLVVCLALAATAATIGVLRYKQGLFLSPEWRGFTTPDNSCSVDLLGRPTEEGDTGEKRYVAEEWYSGMKTWVGWRDLTQLQVQLAATRDGWVSLLPLFTAERDRLKTLYGGAVTKEATRAESPLTHEVRLESPEIRVIERMIVRPEGPHPRIYFIGMAGKNLNFDGDAVKRLFDSFRVIE